MLAEIAVVEKTVAGLNYETFAQNEQALRVVLYSLAVIGEAVTSSIESLEAANPKLPWQQIRRMRNMIIHEYFQLDLEIVWETTQSDLHTLKNALQEILDAL
ncbi:MAG: HepT-like ribonuclease domain-containing protein [Cyanobacteria bacterium J06623_1]